MNPIHKRNVVFTLILCFIILLIFTPSCTHDPVGIEDLDTICYSQVASILSSCNTCHYGPGGDEGFDGTSYDNIMLSVKAGDPKGSALYKAITNINGENMMPPTGPLTLEERTIIEVWIAQGADSTRCPSDTSGNGGEVKACWDSTYFVQEILPLFISGCAYPNNVGDCHDGIPQGGEDELYALNSYPSIRPHVNSVYEAVTGLSEDPMPPQPFSPLSSAEIALLRKWINEGAINNSCSEAGCADTLLTTIGYTAVIKPILNTYCVNCHKSSNMLGGVNLETYLLAKHYAETIKPGTADSYLVGSIRHISGFTAMPYFSTPLNECSIRKIELWIDMGMLEN